MPTNTFTMGRRLIGKFVSISLLFSTIGVVTMIPRWEVNRKAVIFDISYNLNFATFSGKFKALNVKRKTKFANHSSATTPNRIDTHSWCIYPVMLPSRSQPFESTSSYSDDSPFTNRSWLTWTWMDANLSHGKIRLPSWSCRLSQNTQT